MRAYDREIRLNLCVHNETINDRKSGAYTSVSTFIIHINSHALRFVFCRHFIYLAFDFSPICFFRSPIVHLTRNGCTINSIVDVFFFFALASYVDAYTLTESHNYMFLWCAIAHIYIHTDDCTSTQLQILIPS